MKKLLIATAMTLALSVAALAGDIPCGAPQPLPPQGMTQATDATSPGEIPCGLAEQISEAALFGMLTAINLLVL
jgi:hypothetical protein